MNTGITVSMFGVGLAAAGWAANIVRHNHKHGMSSYRMALFFALIGGLCLSGSVASWAGSLIDTKIAGIGIVSIIAIFGGGELYYMMRGHGHHAIWTPALGFAVALALPLMPGVIGHLGQTAGTNTVNIVHSGTTKLGG
jgi:hypothetical protein